LQAEPDWDLAAQAAPDYEVDQRINWRQAQPAILNRCGMALRPGTRAIRDMVLTFSKGLKTRDFQAF
jgi:hypothetical protein